MQKNHYSKASGIDLNVENIISCKNRGFNVKTANLIEYLSTNIEKFDALIFSNVLEHFTYSEIINILNLSYQSLNGGGSLIIIIPNCNNIAGLATYFSDVTHKSALTEKSLEDLLNSSLIEDNFNFFNLIIYPNIVLMDYIVYLLNSVYFFTKRLFNLLNGQKPFKVQSKNLLLVVKKK